MSLSDPVFIKATVREPRLVENSLLVFKTLRVGFPANDVKVFTDHSYVVDAAENTGCDRVDDFGSHWEWLSSLLADQDRPFWICDTDVIFYEAINPEQMGVLTGPFEPGHFNPYTKAWHAPRLHTCLMRIDPVRVRQKLDEFWTARPGTPWVSRHELVSQQWIPGPPLTFHDTMSRLYAAIGGVAFDHKTLDAFTHLHAGTFVDLLTVAYPEMAKAQEHFRNHPDEARGLWRTQLAAQRSHRPKQQLAADPLAVHSLE